MTIQKLPINWEPRFEPLKPVAMIAFGNAARGLKARLLEFSDERLGELQGVFGDDLLFVAGSDLPWSENVIYLGKDPRAPSIWLPTSAQPDLPVDVFLDALMSGFSAEAPFAVVGKTIVPVGSMRPVSRAVLTNAL